MKRLVPWLPLLLAACNNPSSNVDPLGGQTGDDGDVIPGGPAPGGPAAPGPIGPGSDPGPIEPGIPALDDCGYVTRTLDADEVSLFGKSASDLLAGLDSTSPLFWVAYDRPLDGTRYAPGPGESELSITFELRSEDAPDAPATVTEWGPADGVVAHCRPDVGVPVWAGLSTADGALDERLPVTLHFGNGSRAELSYELAAGDVQGGFEILETGEENPGENWQLQALYFDMYVWPGGSSGRVTPYFTLTNPPAVATPPSEPETTPSGAGPGAANTLTTPTHWHEVAVWPTREVCAAGGVPTGADAKLIGVSVNDVVEALNQVDTWQLDAGGASLPVTFSASVPDGLVCADANGSELRFEVNATLEAAPGASDDGGTGSALSMLNATSVFQIQAGTDLAGETLTGISLSRRDVVYSLDRGALAAALGFALDANAEYREFWWDWHATLERGAADDWTRAAELVVTSLNAEQTAEIERVVSQGGPGAGISFTEDGTPELPGDVLLRAATAE